MYSKRFMSMSSNIKFNEPVFLTLDQKNICHQYFMLYPICFIYLQNNFMQIQDILVIGQIPQRLDLDQLLHLIGTVVVLFHLLARPVGAVILIFTLEDFREGSLAFDADHLVFCDKHTKIKKKEITCLVFKFKLLTIHGCSQSVLVPNNYFQVWFLKSLAIHYCFLNNHLTLEEK